MNLFGAFEGLRQRMSGNGVRPTRDKAVLMRAWLGYSANSSARLRVASPMFTQAKPPGASTRAHSSHTASSTACMASKAALPWPASRAATDPGASSAKTSSHMAIIG